MTVWQFKSIKEISSIGRATLLHGVGYGFESCISYHPFRLYNTYHRALGQAFVTSYLFISPI